MTYYEESASANLDARLVEAAKQGDIPAMADLVGKGARINAPQLDYTPLVWAAQNAHTGAVKWLLENGAEVDRASSANKWTPLMSGISSGSIEVIQLLLDAGADKNLRNSEGKAITQLAKEKGGAVADLIGRTPEEVSFFDRIADRVVQEVYSFKRRERFTFIRKSEEGDVEAVQRERFADLGQDDGLRKAFNEHVKRGGKLAEEEVFSGVTSKLRKTLPVPKA